MRRPLLSATIRPDSPRAAAWRAVFGGETVPIMEPTPTRGSAPGKPSAEFYRMPLRELSGDQLDRLVALLARAFDVWPEEVRAGLARDGFVPILAEDVTVAIDTRAFL